MRKKSTKFFTAQGGRGFQMRLSSTLHVRRRDVRLRSTEAPAPGAGSSSRKSAASAGGRRRLKPSKKQMSDDTPPRSPEASAELEPEAARLVKNPHCPQKAVRCARPNGALEASAAEILP